MSSDSTWQDPKVLVAIYAAVVATGTLVWNMVRATRENRKVVRLDVGFSQSWVQQGSVQSPTFANVTLRIRNHSKSNVFINRPTFIVPKEIDTGIGKSDRLENPGTGTFPKELKPGEPIKIEYRIKPLIDIIGNQLDSKDKILIEVTDSFDHVYRSNKKRYQIFKDQAKLSDDLNQQGK